MEQLQGISQKKSQSESSFEENDDRLSKILEKLDLKGIESWTEQQQHSVRKLLEEYQYIYCSEFKGAG